MSNFYRKFTKSELYTPKDGAFYWREKLLLSFLFFLTLAAFFAYVPSVYFAIKADLILITVIDTLFYVSLIVVLFSKRLSLLIRGLYLVILAYLLGVILLAEVGPFGAGYLWMFVAPIIASVFLERKYVVGSLILNVITLGVLGFLQYYKLIANGFEYGFNYGVWIVISANFIFLNVIVVASIYMIVKGLEVSYNKQIEVSETLENQKKELVKAKETAENSVKMKSEFLAQISHEIRTPLNTILSFISLIKGEFGGKQSEEIDDSFGMIENGSKRIIRTIDLILNMSEVQTKSVQVNKQHFNLIQNVLLPLHNEFHQIATNKGLSFTCNNQMNDDAVIYADSYTVSQMFANLIDNAIKYTKKGSIEIICRRDNAGKVIVDVVDSGIGISEDFMNDLFTPFTQEESGYTRKYEGVGLGLSLVKGYCELNNLKLLVESKKNVGTTFSIEFEKGIVK